MIVLGDTREAAALRRALPISSDGVGPTAPRRDAARLVIDARHPFEAPTPREDVMAAARDGGYLRLLRPEWRPTAGDDWRSAATPMEARSMLEPSWRRVLLTLGRDALDAFANDSDRLYLVRVRGGDGRERLDLTRCRVLPAEGPYTVEGEAALMRAERIDALVTRNAGGEGAYPKIAAARRLGVPVTMVSRPSAAGAWGERAAGVDTAETVEAALDWTRRRLETAR